MKRFLFALAFLASACFSSAQDIQVNRQNKTIAVTADESVTADAGIAVLSIGYHNYAPTQDGAFRENVRVAEHITKVLLDAKVPQANIETEKLRLARADIDERWTTEMKKDRQFAAEQSWHVVVPASEAQTVVDLSVRAGANKVDDVQWIVADPVALQAKAGAAALAKARAVADQMAKGLGTKLGELVFASNRAPTDWMSRGRETIEVMAPPPPMLTLFPQKVTSDATIFCVFD